MILLSHEAGHRAYHCGVAKRTLAGHPSRVNPRLALLVSWLLLVAGEGLAQQAPLGPDYRIRPLSGPASGDPLDICMDHLERSRADLGLSAADVDALVLRDRSVSRETGTTHLYFRQNLDGIGIFGSEMTVAVDAQGRVLTQGERLVRGLQSRARSRGPALSAAEAIARAAEHLGIVPSGPVVEVGRVGGRHRRRASRPPASRATRSPPSSST